MPMTEDDDYTFRYMSRFGCIGPACEEHCCGGWQVDVDKKRVDTLKLAAGTAGSDRERIRTAFKKRPEMPQPTGKKRRSGPKPEAFVMKMDRQGNCVLLEPDRRCHIHATLGAHMLPDVCAVYPRRLVKIGQSTQLTASVSCPELARQVLLHDDAVDRIPLDREMLPRKMVHYKVDTRDIRPYLRLMPDVRGFAWKLLNEESRPFNHRLFALTLFAHRTKTSLANRTGEGDLDAVREEVRRLDDPAVLDEIGRRFDAIETPALPVLLVARELVRGDVIGQRNPGFRRLVHEAFDTYATVDLRSMRDRSSSANEAMTAAIQADYLARRDRALSLARPRIDRYLRNFTLHSWVHHVQTEAPDLMVFSLRLLVHLAAVRFLFFSHPKLHRWFTEHPADHPASGDFVGEFEAACDEAIVEVVRKLGRYIDHSRLITTLEKRLTERQMGNLAGAVHLIKF
jgi:lysine-N-methylase